MSKEHFLVDMPFEQLIEDRFGKYAKYIILDRALPDVRDGLKPVQRRILYAMAIDGNVPSKPYRKSAKTVGLVIGNYHPHGDSSVYDAMVRMSQPWKNNHILVDMQGNNGSIDDDPAAAMRYTEARLSDYGYTLVSAIDENTVDFIDNFDDSDIEPTVLPGWIPNLLVNGATGIAAGYATNMPPHNLNEVLDALIMRLHYPDASLDQIMEVLPGPDFPTGGLAINKEEMRNYFESGKGKITLRAKVESISKKTYQQLIITEIPYEVIKSNLVRKIDELCESKTMEGFVDVRDESDRNGLKIVIDIKADADIEIMKALLFKHTDAQVYYNVNMVAILKRAPKQLSLLELLDGILAHQKEVLLRQSKSRIDKLQKRIHVVEGLIKAISVLDEVIALIRASKNKADAKEALIDTFVFSEEQAEAIVSLRLYRLTNTDIVALKEEFALGVNQIDYYQSLLDSSSLLDSVIIEHYKEIKEKYGKDRLTTLVDEVSEVTIEKTQLMVNERVWISVSEDGYIKRVSLRSVMASSGDSGYKENDRPIGESECDLLDTLILILSDGSYAYVPIYEMSEAKYKDIGEHFSSIVKHESNVKVIGGFVVHDFDTNIAIMTVTKKGFIKQSMVKDFQLTRYTKTSMAMKLAKGDEIVATFSVSDNQNIALLSKQGFMVVYLQDQVPVSSLKAKGVKAMNLATKDSIVDGILLHDNDEYVLLTTHQQTLKRIKISELRSGNRPYKGDRIAKLVKSNPAYMVSCFSGTSSSVIDVINGEKAKLWFKDVPIKSKDTTFASSPLEKEFVCIKGIDVLDYVQAPSKKPTQTPPSSNQQEQEQDDSKHVELMQFELK